MSLGWVPCVCQHEVKKLLQLQDTQYLAWDSLATTKKFYSAAVGALDSIHDSRLLKSCDLFTDFQQGHVFPNSALRTREYGDRPFTTVGDSAFPRCSWLTKPYNKNTRDPRIEGAI